MSKMMNLPRRVKKHLVARRHTCFAVTAPGLEGLCRRELTQPPLSLTETKIVPGGVEFQGRLHELLGANLHLRTATRLLLRVASLRAFSFDEFELRVSKIPWELYLPWQTLPQVQASLHKCRLYHSGAVAQRLTHAIQGRWRQLEDEGREIPSESIPQTIFVRGMRDRITLSLDSSGDPLYLRGVKTQGGRAPLRETLAAAVLMRAGYEPGMTLLDPMTGTGTFALEAALMAAGKPPGWYRGFAFQSWPAFQTGRWRHLRRQAAEFMVPFPDHPSILAMDIDGAGCQALKRRLGVAHLEPWVTVTPGDFLQTTPRQVAQYVESENPGLVALNPPYGLRLEDPQACIALYRKISRHLIQHFRGWRLALMVPPQIQLADIPIQGAIHPISHGGLSLKLLTGRI